MIVPADDGPAIIPAAAQDHPRQRRVVGVTETDAVRGHQPERAVERLDQAPGHVALAAVVGKLAGVEPVGILRDLRKAFGQHIGMRVGSEQNPLALVLEDECDARTVRVVADW